MPVDKRNLYVSWNPSVPRLEAIRAIRRALLTIGTLGTMARAGKLADEASERGWVLLGQSDSFTAQADARTILQTAGLEVRPCDPDHAAETERVLNALVEETFAAAEGRETDSAGDPIEGTIKPAATPRAHLAAMVLVLLANNEKYRADAERLRGALEEIADGHERHNPGWWIKKARAALAQSKEGSK